MRCLLGIVASLAFFAPFAGASPYFASAETSSAGDHKQDTRSRRATTSQINQTIPLADWRDHLHSNQVRIERRVVVRITPQRLDGRQEMLAQFPQQSLTTKFEEKETADCLEIDGIGGVQTGSGSRLLLFLRDQRMMSIHLEKTCLARQFYSGFYVEKNEDGKLCVNRDKLQSRSGATCEVKRIRQLVAVNK